jgi:hypothetical protein
MRTLFQNWGVDLGNQLDASGPSRQQATLPEGLVERLEIWPVNESK